MIDPIVVEVRTIRREIEKEFGADSERYFQHLLEVQKRYQDRLVSRKPQPSLRAADKKLGNIA